MAGLLTVFPRTTVVNGAGAPYAGALAYFYVAGTTTLLSVYPTAADADAGTNALTNPVTADSNGRFAAVYVPSTVSAYRLRVTTSAGVSITDDDNIPTTAITADGIGSALYPRTATEQSASVTPTDYTYPPGDIRRYGAVGDNSTNCTTAITNALAANDSVFIPEGTFLTDTITVTSEEKHIHGAGRGASILKSRAGSSVLTFQGTSCHSFTLEHLTIQGNGGSGHGIVWPSTGITDDPFNIVVRDVIVRNCGGRGIYDARGIFTSLFENVWVDNCLSHQFDLLGNNTLTLTNCYALNSPTAGTAGFRIHGGNPVLINCNGLNSGEYWGIFSDTLAADGVDRYCRPTLIGCNIEDFTIAGIWNKQSGVTLHRCVFVAPSTGTVKAVLVNPGNNVGMIDNDTEFTTKGASWTNSRPVHVSSAGLPFQFVPSYLNDQLTWYDDGGATDQSLSTYLMTTIRSNRYAVAPFDLYCRGLFRNKYSGTATLSGGTASVTLSPALPDANYAITLSGNANETFRWSSKATGGFTITSSNAGSTASVDWFVSLVG